MSSEVRGARVLAYDVPVRLGSVEATAEAADLDLLPSQGAVNLDKATHPMAIHAARVDIPGSEIEQVVRRKAAGAGVNLAVRLAGHDSFVASGKARGMPFAARGRLTTRKGKFAAVLNSVDITDHGIQAQVDVQAGKARVHASNAQLLRLVEGASAGLGRRSASGGAWLVDPELTWRSATNCVLSGKLPAALGGYPLKAEANVNQPDAKGTLGIHVGPIQVAVPGAPASVDLAAGTATAQISPSAIAKAIQAGPGWSGAKLRWLDGDHVKAQGDLVVPEPLASLVGPTARVQATASVAAVNGKVVAAVGRLQVSGDGFSLTYTPASKSGTAQVDTATLSRALDRISGGQVQVEKIQSTGDGQIQVQVKALGSLFDVTGKVAGVKDGKVVLQLEGIAALEGAAKIPVTVDPETGRIHATVPPEALAALPGVSSLSQYKLTPLAGDRLAAASTRRWLGIPVPVQTVGSVALDSKGRIAYTVDGASVFGIPILGLLRMAGKSMQDLEGGHWTGNTLRLTPKLPGQLKLAAFHTQPGAFAVDLVPPESLSQAARGLDIHGNQLEFDPAEVMPLPGRVTSLSVDATGLVAGFQVDAAGLARLVRLPRGIAFDGKALSIDPEVALGRSLPGKLVKVSGSAAGVAATVALDPALLQRLHSLPRGVQLHGDTLEIEPEAAGLPGHVESVSGGPNGIDVELAISRPELAGLWHFPAASGLAWDGQALTVDPAALQPGVQVRAEGIRVHKGDLVVDVGDGTPLPAPGKAPGLYISDPGVVQAKGMDIRGLQAVVTPGSPGAPVDLAHLGRDHVKVDAGQVRVSAAQIDQMIHKVMSPADLARYQPRFVNGKVHVTVHVAFFDVGLSLAFHKTADGKLELSPDGLIGSLLGGGHAMTIDIAKSLGIDIAPLKEVQAGSSGLTLTF